MFSLDDLKYAIRLLKKQPVFSLLAIIVLAGGLAVSLYTFSLLQTALYKDLPLPEGGRIVRVLAKSETGSGLFTFEIQQMRARVTRLEELGLYRGVSATIAEQDVSRTVNATVAEPGIFEFTRTQPLMGRGLQPADSTDGAEPVAVIGHSLWQSQFAGDPNILERVVRVDNVPRRIVGVMPEGYAFPVRSQMWLPLSRSELNAPAYAAGGLPGVVSVYGRLAGGATAGDAAAELSQLLLDVRQQHPRRENDGYRYDAIQVMSFQRADLGSGGIVLFAVLNCVALAILLLACANVGNMLLVRTNERAGEIAVRVALGAPRKRLISQMTLESLIISVVGGAIALLLAAWWLRGTNRILHSLNLSLPYWMQWGLDGRAVAAAVAFVLLAVLLVAALPILSASSVQSASLLRENTRAGGQGRASGRITRFLVTLQIVLISLVMVAGGALTVIAKRFVDVDFGIESDRLLFLEAYGPAPQVAPEQMDKEFRRYDQRMLAELRSDRTIESVMIWTSAGDARFAVDNTEYPDVESYPHASAVVSSDAPMQLGAKLLEGRYFDHRETAGGARSVLVSRTMAELYWPGASPIGRSVRLVGGSGHRGEPMTVVGVVSDVLDRSRVLQADRRAYTTLVLPTHVEMYKAPAEFLVRHRGNEEETRRAMQQIVDRLDGTLARPIAPYTEELESSIRLASAMTNAFQAAGLFALLLGLTGIYGLCRNEVVRRTQEIGLRRAVGATERSILQLLLRQSVRRLLIGLLVGAGLSAIALFALLKFAALGVPTLLAIGFAVAATISLLVASSSWFSTRGVLRGEPSEALRYE